MQRGQFVALALAGVTSVLLQGCAQNAAATETVCTAYPCEKCGAWVTAEIQGQVANYQNQLGEVCKLTAGGNITDLSTGVVLTTQEDCMNQGQKFLEKVNKNHKTWTKQCSDAVVKGAAPSETATAMDAAFLAWRNATAEGEASELKKQISGIVVSVAAQWGVQWAPTPSSALAASNTQKTPARLYKPVLDADAMEKQREAGMSSNTLLLGAGVVGLFSLAIVGLRKRGNRATRSIELRHELEDGLEESIVDEGLE